MKNQLPFCPYCKSRMSYLQAWGIHKDDGEYRCPRCGKASNIRYTKRLRTFAAAASALGFLIAVLLVIFRQGIQFGHVLLIIVPFLFFFLLAPFTIVLLPMKGHRKKACQRRKARRLLPQRAFRPPRRAFSEERPVSEEKTDPYREKFYDPDPPGKNAGDSLEISSASHSGYYSSKYDFSLFEETRRIDKVKNNPSVSKRRQAQRFKPNGGWTR